MLAIVIPAAGASSRMRGADKLAQDVDGRPALTHTVAAAVEVAGHVCVALPPDKAHPRWQMLESFDVQRVAVPEPERGVGVSLATAIAALPPKVHGVMITMPDMPDIGMAEMQAVVQHFDPRAPDQILQATTGNGLPGHPTLFGANYLPLLKALSGDRGAYRIIQDKGPNVVPVPLPGHRARRDLDTPEDWADWRSQQS